MHYKMHIKILERQLKRNNAYPPAEQKKKRKENNVMKFIDVH